MFSFLLPLCGSVALGPGLGGLAYLGNVFASGITHQNYGVAKRIGAAGMAKLAAAFCRQLACKRNLPFVDLHAILCRLLCNRVAFHVLTLLCRYAALWPWGRVVIEKPWRPIPRAKPRPTRRHC
jgi:hypothetical protein